MASAKQQIQELTQRIGKAGVHALFPNDFEYYAITFELTDSKGKTIEYLTFPVNPDSIFYDKTTLTNIKKTMGGVVALDTQSYVPAKIDLQGTFGRKLKLLTNKADTISSPNSTVRGKFTKIDGSFEFNSSIFNAKIKSGYGTMKLLEALIEKSTGLDEFGQPNRLFFYNPALGHSFLVKINAFKATQDVQTSNMLYKYILGMTCLLPLNRMSDDQTKTSLIASMKYQIINSGINNLASSIKRAF